MLCVEETAEKARHKLLVSETEDSLADCRRNAATS